LFQRSHSHTGDHEYCEACGQRLPPPGSLGYGAKRKHNRYGIGFTIGLHVLAGLYVLFQPKLKIPVKPPAKAGEMVWVAPLPVAKPTPKPSPKPQPQKTEVAKAQPAPRTKTITKTAPPRQETFVPPVQATMKPPPVTPVEEVDMMARVEAARRRRGEAAPQPQQESEADRANRVARANIMGAQGRNAAGERDDGGGVLSVIDRTSFSARIKFRGWNNNFKRNWSQDVSVDIGNEIDIETAVIKRMIELIRKEKPGDFVWESRRLGRNIPMSARKEDQPELEAFLMKEFFPEYRRGGR